MSTKENEMITNKEEVMMKKTLKIEGMMCHHCTGRVDKVLNEMDGVKATVSLEGKSAEVTLTKDITDEELACLTLSDIRSAMEEM